MIIIIKINDWILFYFSWLIMPLIYILNAVSWFGMNYFEIDAKLQKQHRKQDFCVPRRHHNKFTNV